MTTLESRYLGEGEGRLHVLTGGGAPDGAAGPAVCLVHGNLSTSRFFAATAESLPSSWPVAVPDLRGFGLSGPASVDATTGLRDYADDLHRVLSSGLLPGRPVHLAGWSLGGGVVMQYAIDHPERVASVTLVAPLSPSGYGGTKGVDGALCYADGAGSGAGVVNPELVSRIRDKDWGDESPVSPRSVIRALYVRPPLRFPADVEDLFVGEILATAVGEGNYPGDSRPSAHWPGSAPGTRGVANSMSPLYCDLSGFARVAAHRPVLWVRGDSDAIVSDASPLDAGYLGSIGVIPGWPGEQAFPAQPMVSQTRAVLQQGVAMGGTFVEEVFADCGHAPHLEQPDKFRELFTGFVTSAEAALG
jgi:pimeloyl-ACP methyl ester carboxylesterase